MPWPQPKWRKRCPLSAGSLRDGMDRHRTFFPDCGVDLTTDREIDGGRVGRCAGGHTKMIRVIAQSEERSMTVLIRPSAFCRLRSSWVSDRRVSYRLVSLDNCSRVSGARTLTRSTVAAT